MRQFTLPGVLILVLCAIGLTGCDEAKKLADQIGAGGNGGSGGGRAFAYAEGEHSTKTTNLSVAERVVIFGQGADVEAAKEAAIDGCEESATDCRIELTSEDGRCGAVAQAKTSSLADYCLVYGSHRPYDITFHFAAAETQGQATAAADERCEDRVDRSSAECYCTIRHQHCGPAASAASARSLRITP